MNKPRHSTRTRSTTRHKAPQRVEVVYRKIDGLHVFETPDFLGLHSADANLRNAFSGIGDAVTAYMRTLSAKSVDYRPEISFSKFQERLKSSSFTEGRRFHAELQVCAAPANA